MVLTRSSTSPQISPLQKLTHQSKGAIHAAGCETKEGPLDQGSKPSFFNIKSSQVFFSQKKIKKIELLNS